MDDFDYDQAAWDRAAKDGNCAFDTAGLTAVLADARERYHIESRVFMTGWEAGGHVVLAQLLNEPERLRGVVVVTPNFQGRCVTEPAARHDAAAMRVPVRNLVGGNDDLGARGPISAQWGAFGNLARTRGFADLQMMSLPGRGHGSLAPDVVNVVASWIRGGARGATTQR
jgi:dienelactone hydrolase